MEMLHNSGISVSNDGVPEISALLGKAVVTQYVQEKVTWTQDSSQYKLSTTLIITRLKQQHVHCLMAPVFPSSCIINTICLQIPRTVLELIALSSML